jgi:hypothetical protein
LRLMYRFVTVKAHSPSLLKRGEWPAPTMGRKIGAAENASGGATTCPLAPAGLSTCTWHWITEPRAYFTLNRQA